MYFVYEQIVSARSKMADHDFVSADKQLASLQNYAEEKAVVDKPQLSEVLAKINTKLYNKYGIYGLMCYGDVEKILSEYFD